MSVETLRRSRKRAFVIFPICMFIWSITRTELFQAYFKSQFQIESHSHLKSFLISETPNLIGVILVGFGLYPLLSIIKKMRMSEMSVQNILKDELTKFEGSYALHLSFVLILILLLILTSFGAFGLSGKDVSLLLFGAVVGLPLLIFSVRDNLNE